MAPVLGGSLSALLLGTSDFVSRFTTRALGAPSALLGVLLTGCVLLSVWVWFEGGWPSLPVSGWWLVLLNGISTTVMTLLLYAALARGPVSLVAPIVASHPALVVLFYVALGERPGTVQWLGMALTVVGVVMVARSSEHFLSVPGYSRTHLRRTLLMSGAAALAYVVLVVAGQKAVPIYGDLHTLWLSRLVSLATLLLLFVLILRKRPRLPRAWMPVVVGQGTAESAGYFCLLAASGGPGDSIAAVAASTFGAITTLLARFVLKEMISAFQWLGIAFIVLGVAALSLAG